MLVLASASPRRRDLLAQAGFTFEVLPSSASEDLRPAEDPVAYVLRVAREKAEAVAATPEFRRLAARSPEPPILLGADTTVVAPSGAILMKPEDDADAARMLRLLSGATHRVLTGVALVAGGDASPQQTRLIETAVAITHVTMQTLSDEEIAAYIASGEPQGKAGAYAIQGRAGRWIPRIHGCYFNVVGLPLALVTGMLEGMQAHLRRCEEARSPAPAL